MTAWACRVDANHSALSTSRLIRGQNLRHVSIGLLLSGVDVGQRLIPVATSAVLWGSTRYAVDVVTAWTVVAGLWDVTSPGSQVDMTIARTGSDVRADAASRGDWGSKRQ